MLHHHPVSKKKLKITIVSVPFSGHFKILKQLAISFAAQREDIELNFIVTGWTDLKINQEDREELQNAGVRCLELSHHPILSSQPMTFTFPRVVALTDSVVAASVASDYIIYDFFSLEGYLAGIKLNIPTLCSIPAIVGEFDVDNQLLQNAKTKNADLIAALEKKFNISLINKLEMVSDGFFLQSDYQNIIWSWPKLISSTHYAENRKVKNYLFLRPENAPQIIEDRFIAHLREVKASKKIIYLSLGTVVTGNLWDKVPATRAFIRKIFDDITEKYANNNNYEVVVATGRDISDLYDTQPKNFHIFKSVNQQHILTLADVFVTHGGGNSVNEAIDAEVPMVVIPFFGDQHVCALNIARLKIGISFDGDDDAHSQAALDTESNRLVRNSLQTENAVHHAIQTILSDSLYKKNLQKLKAEKPQTLKTLSNILINDKTLNWREGDLLYGCNDDRVKLATLTGRNDFYRLCNLKPFSTLFNDIESKACLPRIIDQYHDVLMNTDVTGKELQTTRFPRYVETIKHYQTYIKSYLDELRKLDCIKDSEKYDVLLSKMCVAGLEFFIYLKQQTIHFVIEKFNDNFNLVTRHELAWIKNHWHDDMVRRHVKFYCIQNGKLFLMDPLKTNWFKSRPTPQLVDRCPDLVNEKAWCNTMRAIKERTPHLFFNHLPHRYSDEFAMYKSSGLHLIDMQNTPELAKKIIKYRY